MKDEEFPKIVSGIIKPYGDIFCKIKPTIGWKLGWEAELENAYYQRKEEAYNKLNTGKTSANFDKRIDRHKRSAALMLAILECSPLIFKQSQTKHTVLEKFPNEVLAFKTAIQVITEIALEDAAIHNDPQKIAYLKQDFTYPPASDGVYCEHIYKALYHAKLAGKFELLLLSNLLFVLESYNDLYKQKQISSNT